MIFGSKRWEEIIVVIVIVVGLGGGAVLIRWTGNSGQSFDLSEQPAQTQAAYMFADESRDRITEIPCYCGCGASLGHESLLDCFVAADGRGFDSHASACVICTDEAKDVRQLAAEGVAVGAIRVWIDEKYRTFGAPTNTP